MDGLNSTFAWENVSEDFALFRTLSSGQRLKAFGAMVRQDLVRGQMLVAQGEPSDALFVVLHGALAVRKAGDDAPIAELRAGELAFTRGAAAKSAEPRPGWRACLASCITMSRSRIRSISTA